MRVLILSCSTGGGHNAAAAAISDELTIRGIENMTDDTLVFMQPQQAQPFVKNSYDTLVTRYPKVWKTIFDIGYHLSSPRVHSPVYLANASYSERLGRYIEAKGIDTAICTHPFGAQVLSHLRDWKGFDIATYAVATDYICLPFWEECDLDYFIVPHVDTIPDFVKRGVPEGKIKPLGLPVGVSYRGKGYEQKDARELLELPTEGTNYLILTGSMGFGDVLTMPEKLLRGDPGGHVVVVSGHNDSLRTDLIARYCDDRRVTVVGYTKKSSIYLDACDVVFSKPGGLTSTEIASKGKPLVHTSAIPGFEVRNAEFFRDHGMSVIANSCDEAVERGLELASDKKRCEAMCAAQRANVDALAACRICDLMEDMDADRVSGKVSTRRYPKWQHSKRA